MPHVNPGPLSAGLAIPDDILSPANFEDDKLSLGILARTAENEFVDEDIEEFTKAIGVMSTVDDVAVVLFVKRSLGAKFAAEELGGVGRGTAQCASDVGHVGDHGFYAVTFSLDFGEEDGHAAGVS